VSEGPLDLCFEIELRSTGAVLPIGEEETILEVLAAAGISVVSSCEMGICGTCETTVVSGEIDHRDDVLMDDERASGTTMMICCSRGRGRLVLDM
jgi:ferredoxin